MHQQREKIFFIKNIYLTIYETLATYEKYRKFINDYTNVNLPECKPKLDQLSTDIKNFKKDFEYNNHINIIRNNVSGHISKDFTLYYETIRQFNGEKTVRMCIAFFKIIQTLQNYSSDLLKAQKNDKNKITELELNAETKFKQLKELIKNRSK